MIGNEAPMGHRKPGHTVLARTSPEYMPIYPTPEMVEMHRHAEAARRRRQRAVATRKAQERSAKVGFILAMAILMVGSILITTLVGSNGGIWESVMTGLVVGMVADGLLLALVIIPRIVSTLRGGKAKEDETGDAYEGREHGSVTGFSSRSARRTTRDGDDERYRARHFSATVRHDDDHVVPKGHEDDIVVNEDGSAENVRFLSAPKSGDANPMDC